VKTAEVESIVVSIEIRFPIHIVNIPTRSPMTDSLLPRAGRDAGKPLKFPSTCCDPKTTEIDWSLGWVSSPKLDGNRCLIIDGVPYTSSMRPFRNDTLNDLLEPLLNFSRAAGYVFDLEIYDPEGTHHAALSGILNSYKDEIPDSVRFYLFDGMPTNSFLCQSTDLWYGTRIGMLSEAVNEIANDYGLVQHYHMLRFEVLPQRPVFNHEEIVTLYNKDIADGYEGSIIRSTSIDSRTRGGWYKHGRATDKQQIGFKIKAFSTRTGKIIGVIPRRLLDPEAMVALGIERTRNPDGSMAHVHQKGAYVDTDMTGAFLVEYQHTDSEGVVTTQRTEIGFGVGFDHDERRRLFSIKESLHGKHVEFSMMEHGALDKPRHGRLVRFRSDLDGV
jgi:hypothetical protein